MNALLPNDFVMFAKNADFHSYGTRNRDTVHMTTCRLNLRKHSIHFFRLQIMELFASINIRNSQGVYSFTRHYKSILIDNIVH